MRTIEFSKDMERFRPMIGHIVAISVLIGVMALGPTIYNMALYDRIITGDSSSAVMPLLFGVAMAFAMEWFFRTVRSRQLATFGARLDHVIGRKILKQLLNLPTMVTERASVAAQIARLRDFDSVRDFFTGALAPLFFELPLVAVYLAVMAMISPVLALVPLGLVACYAVLISLSFRKFRDAGVEASRAAAQRQEFVLETVTKLRSLRLDGMEAAWRKRYAELSSASSKFSAESALLAQNFETVSYAMMTVGAAATLCVGVTSVIEGSLSVGGLVAAMILIWRVVSPLQVCCASMTRLQQLSATFGQIKKMMNLPAESEGVASDAHIPSLRGEVEFYRVGMRYSADAEPALLGVGFKVDAGQVVTIRGPNGSGKSTLLKMIMGLYTPQSGCVRLDGIDIRQRDPILLRRAISYVPQNAQFFPGTIRDNFLVCVPDVTEVEIESALRMSCAADEVAALPLGLETVIAGPGAENVSFLLKQRLNLARAYLRPASIMLFDEASHSLGSENDAAFFENIEAWRGQRTIIIVTHREDHARLADKVLTLDRGEIINIEAPRNAAIKQGVKS